MAHIFESDEMRVSAFDIKMRLKDFEYEQYEAEKIAEIIQQEYNVYESYDVIPLKFYNRIACMILIPVTFAILMPCKWLITGKSNFNSDSKFSKFMLKIMGQKS